MFEKAGWREAQPPVGPIPEAPCAEWGSTELLRWAPRAPFSPAWLAALQQLDASSLNPIDRLRLAQAWNGFRQASEAAFLAAVGAVDPQSCPVDGPQAACPGGNRCTHDWSTDEVAAALHVAPVTASSLLTDARDLVGRTAVLLEAVASGHLPAYAARAISRRLMPIADLGVVDAVLGRVLNRVGLVTPSQLIRLADVTLEALRDPAEALAAHQRARKSHTGITPGMPLEDGMGSAIVTASVAEIAELLSWAREFTSRNRDPDDTRTVGERRVHALLDSLHQATATAIAAETATAGCGDMQASESSGAGSSGAGSSGAGSSGAGSSGAGSSGAGSSGAGSSGAHPAAAPVLDRRPAQRPAISLRLIMTADSLLGRNNDPAWLGGVGEIPAYLARVLALGPGSLQRALVDRDGTLLNLGREQRFATTALAEHIRARDHFCTGLGCTRLSDRAELDHIVPWAQGGRTDVDDLHANCPRHHRSQDAGWLVTRTSEQTTWTSPTGITYVTVRPPPDRPRPWSLGGPAPDRGWDPLEAPPPWGHKPLPPSEDPPF